MLFRIILFFLLFANRKSFNKYYIYKHLCHYAVSRENNNSQKNEGSSHKKDDSLCNSILNKG